NVVSTYSQVCFEVVDTGVEVETVPVVEDVTAAVGLPDSVYPDVNDLSVGYQDSEVYLKFVVGPIDGRITRATIHLRSAADASATGDGGELYAVPSNAWSENTLTWNTRPATAGGAIAPLSGVAPDQWYVIDASSAVTSDGTYSFAVVPRTTDLNSAHFLSKEASATYHPYLRIEYVVEDNDGDGVPDGPDCDDTNPAVFPGATEVCNGVDDDCDGEVDEGCGGPCTGDATEPCGLDVGGCVPGTRTCVGGQWSACVGAVEPVPERCGNGVDDDCDGEVDEGCDGGDAGTGGSDNVDTGCSCRAAPDAGAPLLLLFAYVLGWVARRRRRR
ncbi:MAG: DNRLRE domain-containing protein, partial [bacterium]